MNNNLYGSMDVREDFVDLVAQAVLDKIEEREQVAGLVRAVAQRVREMQKEEEELRVAEIRQAQVVSSGSDSAL